MRPARSSCAHSLYGSSNLDEGERDGVKQIHERCLTWIQYLDGDINTTCSTARATDAAAESVRSSA